MSITSITIENFKGIRDRVTIDLKPITLLFGPNSAGKSTIIQALHYVWEVIGRHNLDPNFTEFGGREIDLGGFENLIYGHDLNRALLIRLDMDLKNKNLPIYQDPEAYKFQLWPEDEVEDWESMEAKRIPLFRWNVGKKEINNGWVEFQVSWSELNKKFQVSSYDVGLNDEIIIRITVSGDSNNVKIAFINFFHPLLKVEDSACLSHCDWVNDLITLIALDPLLQFDHNAFSYDNNGIDQPSVKSFKEFLSLKEETEPDILEIRERTNDSLKKMTDKELRQILKDYSLHNADWSDRDSIIEWIKTMRMLEMEKEQYLEKLKQRREEPERFDKIMEKLSAYEFLFICAEVFGLNSINDALDIECLGLEDAIPQKECFQLNLNPKSYRNLLEEIDFADALDSAIKQFTIGPLDILREELEKLVYLGPIRSRIPRNYVPNRYIERRNWPDGLAAWDVLHKEDAGFIKQVDHWMADRLKSGYQISRETYKEIDATQVSNTQGDILKLYNSAPIKTRFCLKDKKSGVEVQAPDVGVGISQVIPVVVAALYFNDGIVSIEQPELHIHPALQVTLGDLFISQTQKKGLCFIIETHSEHMLLRLLRRIRETTENEAPEKQNLTPEDLSIYFIEAGEQGVSCMRIRVDHEGDFIDPWPRGFFVERAMEMF